MIKQFYFLLSILICVSTHSYCQDVNRSKQLTEFVEAYPQEKVYLVTDRDTYVAGEDIWFAAHLVNAKSHQPVPVSLIVYIDLVNKATGDIVQSRSLEVSKGFAKGDFTLDYEVVDGSYELIAYTWYMQNFDPGYFFKKTLNIISNDDHILKKEKSKKHTIQFFPEGGNLIDGVENQTSLKIVDEFGVAISTTGEVIDQEGQIVSRFETNNEGLGTFLFTPKPGLTYKARIKNGDKKITADLPTPLKSGFGMAVKNEPNRVVVTIQKSSEDLSIVGHRIFAHVRGTILFSYLIDKEERNQFGIISEKFPPGVLHLTHFDEKGKPRNERLVFIEAKDNQLSYDLDNSQLTNQRLEDQSLSFTVLDKKQNPVAGNYTMSIVDQTFADSSINIEEYLLLQSDLPGKIQNMKGYFDKNLSKRQRMAKQDLLMRTHGWRRFTWEQVAQKEEYKLNYFPEVYGFNRSFKVHKPDQINKPVKANVEFVTFDPFAVEQVTSGDDGIVRFIGIQAKGSTAYYLKANVGEGYKKISRKEYKPIYDNLEITPISSEIVQYDLKEIISSTTRKEEIDKENIMDDPRIGQNFFNIFLDPIVVNSTSPRDPRFSRTSMAYIEPDKRVRTEDFPSNLSFLDMIRTVPGVSVAGNPNNAEIRIRGLSTLKSGVAPLILLDGVPIEFDFVARLTSFEIDFIDVLRGPSAAVYGTRGFNGVIAVYTKNEAIDGAEISFNERIGQMGTLSSNFSGFYEPREYYNPMFVEDEAKRMIYAPTLYWNANIEEEKIVFQNPDYPAEYLIKIEGVTETGIPVYFESTYQVD